MSMDPTRVPRYDSEDTTPTSPRELRGWFSYGMAAEVFAVCGIGSFLPVTLEQLAREQGVLWSDKTTPCLANVKDARGLEKSSRFTARREDGQCIVRPFGKEITTASFAMYTFSLAVLIQAATLVSFSSFADHGSYRKRLLLMFGFTGAVSSILFIFVVPQLYLLGPVLVIIGVTCLGSSFVLLNSFLPLLTSNHPSLSETSAEANEHSSTESDLDLGNDHSIVAPVPSRYHKAFDGQQPTTLQLSTQISSTGVGLGYCAAVSIQCLSIVVLYTMGKAQSVKSSATLALRVVLLMVGLCWAVGTIPAVLWIRDRPGPPLASRIGKSSNAIRTFCIYVVFAWQSLWKTIKTAAKLREMRVFLLAWFLLSDGIATVSGTAILFARTELHLGTVAIAVLSITATSSGIVGAIAWPRISKRLHWSTNQTIIVCLLLMEIVPIYGLLGFIPFVKAWGVGGLQQGWEIFPLGFIYGFVMGGLSSYCRAFVGQLIPPGHEAAFYALYAVTDKGSSAVGPAVVGAIVDHTGGIRPAFLFLLVLIALPVPLVWMVDVERGRKDASKMAGLMDESRGDAYIMGNRSEDLEDEREEEEHLLATHD